MKDLTGLRFTKLSVLRREGSTKNRKSLWLCDCDCGNEVIAIGSNLTSGHTTSCGCAKGTHPAPVNTSDGLT